MKKFLLTLLLLLNIGYSQIYNLTEQPTECINYLINVTGCIKVNVPDNNFGGLMQVSGDSQLVTFRVDSNYQTVVFDTLGKIGWFPLSQDKIFKHSCCWYNYTLEVCGIYNSEVYIVIAQDIQPNVPIETPRYDICPTFIEKPNNVYKKRYYEMPYYILTYIIEPNKKYKIPKNTTYE